MNVFSHAKSIVSKLVKEGYIAYFAGGWVRDHIMRRPSEDIDIATSASPVEVMNIFPHTILVGLSFGVVIVVIEGHQFEVATFRKDLAYLDGRHPIGIEMSNPREDALRRDFTINGIFYDPLAETIHDFVQGEKDIHRGIIRTIGDPEQRFFEDRLRMLRAFRFAARFEFKIDSDTLEAIYDNVDKLFPSVAMERVWQEFNKMAAYPRFDQALIDMHRTGLLPTIFPELNEMHLNDLKHEVMVYARYPKSTPTIIYLLELFQTRSLVEKIEMGKRLKVTNKDLKLVEFMHQLFEMIQQPEKDLQKWTHVLAHPDSKLGLKIYQARLNSEESDKFTKVIKSWFNRLEPHIERICKKIPLVNATVLQKLGIKPGISMGLLIKEAEKIAIEQDLQDTELVLEILKHSSLWHT